MSQSYVVKLPDVGEGVAEAEIVEWFVNVGDEIHEDQSLADVLTDKATIELSSPVAGTIARLGAEAGDIVPVGSELVWIDIDGAAPDVTATADAVASAEPLVEPASAPPEPVAPVEPEPVEPAPAASGHPRPAGALAAAAVRRRAAALGVDLADVTGTGPDGRVVHEDLDATLTSRSAVAAPAVRPAAARAGDDEIEPVKIVGLRRNIAARMQESSRRIPHFTYVEEVDVTELQRLREELNGQFEGSRPKLTVLPLLSRAVIVALDDFPQLNARFRDDDGVLDRYRAVHLGIATQTPKGLMVPVIEHAEALDIWGLATEIARLSTAARDGTVTLQELHGSTITITSLGALGGIVTTPVINYPEVAVIGVNKIVTRPVFDRSAWIPREVMNLSSSFDHRVVDGSDAAQFIGRLRTLLETPALLWATSTAP
jgi:2-oxoisovalerate dehydrogenase E2 component (dihydrolipoyl transacylase)